MSLTRRKLIVTALATPVLARTAWPAAASPSKPLPAGGVNLAGAEFGNIPGVHGREYLYPPASHFDYYSKLGFTLIRLPFKWERLQPDLNTAFAADELKILVETVRFATDRGQSLIIDPHNYAKRRLASDGWSKEHVIGSDAVPVSAFADFWARLAALFKDKAGIMFGLMNEPTGIGVGDWLNCVNTTIASIRAAGATNLILVPGIDYTGAHSWRRLGNTAMIGVVDPLHNFAFDVHQYFDQDSSGTKPDSVSGTIGSERISDFQNWARANRVKAVLGEFNGGRDRTGANALNDLCQEMTTHPDVWLGWTVWAGGPRWPEDEMFNLEPWQDGRLREQTAILKKYAKPESPNFWVADGATADVDFARHRGYGSALPEDTSSAIYQPTHDLQSLLRSDMYTIVIEISEGAAGADWNVVQAASDAAVDRALVQWTQSGAAMALGLLQTSGQPSRMLPGRRRIALSVDRRHSRISLAATGARAVQASLSASAPDEVTFSRTTPTGAANLRRVTGYTEYLAPEQLEGLCA